MPRLPNSLIREAYKQNPLLVPILKSCRDLESARNELRWLTEHVGSAKSSELAQLARQRGRGVPLQYILGSEWFGDLEIKCRPGVLIPR